MIYDELMQNLKVIIGNNSFSDDIKKIFKTSEMLFQNNEAMFKLEPKFTKLLKGIGFIKDTEGNACILIGQKYIDTYSKNSSLHHTMLIHEMKHLFDYNIFKDKFINCTSKERHWYEFEARNIEVEFINNYLIGKYKLTKLENLVIDSYEKDNLDYFTILFHRISKNIYSIFRNIEIEYNENKFTEENIVKEIIDNSLYWINEYPNSKDNFSRYYNYIKIKSLRNCIEDICLINNENKIINFTKLFDKYGYYISDIYYKLYEIIDDYEKNRSGFMINLDDFLENEYTK